MSRPIDRIPLLTGPTAVGKTRIAIGLAGRLGAEIVSADSRQVYREFGAAVDKPSPADRQRVRHHMIDVRSITEPLSAGEYARTAEKCIQDVLDREKTPIVVGGSTLYVQAIVEGLSNIPPVPDAVRASVRARLTAEGSQPLFDELRAADPEYAATLDVTKTQRLLRGLEVFEATGQPLSSFHRSRIQPPFQYRGVMLDRDRPVLYRRIDERVSLMVERGLIDEARTLREAGFDLRGNPLRTIGYAEAADYLDDLVDLATMTDQIRRNSRRYAKRQITWFRRFRWLQRLGLDELDNEAAVDLLASIFAPDGPGGT